AGVDRVRPGVDFEVAVVVEVQPDHHINSHTPLRKTLIPTDLFHVQTPGLKIDRPLFPPGVIEQQAAPANLPLSGGIGGGLPGAGEKVSVYRDKTVIRIPVTAQPSLSGDSVQMSGVLTYQACNDLTQQCFPPVAAEWELTLPVAAE